MLLKEIFSKKIRSLEENIQNKVLNASNYEKSYLRGDTPFDQNAVQVVDNHSAISNLLKNKIKPLKYFKGKKSSYRAEKTDSNKKTDKNLEGQSINTQNFIYKSRKYEDFKFRVSILKPSLFKNHINELYQSISSLNYSIDKNCTSLLVLTPKRGGFICYASGVLGFLPKKHGNLLFRKTLLILLQDKRVEKHLLNVLFLTCSQKLNKNSFVMRLRCFLGKFRFSFRKKRKKFSLSRKKRSKKNSYRRYTMLFLSHFEKY